MLYIANVFWFDCGMRKYLIDSDDLVLIRAGLVTRAAELADLAALSPHMEPYCTGQTKTIEKLLKTTNFEILQTVEQNEEQTN